MTFSVDNAIVGGLHVTASGTNSCLTVFTLNSTLYAICFDNYSNPKSNGIGVYGFHWNGSTWVDDSSIKVGMVLYETYQKPTTFWMNSVLYLITARGPYHGYHWDTNTWVVDSGIVAGLSSGNFLAPYVFTMGSTYYLIAGDFNGVFYGYHWDTNTWVVDSGIVAGLGDVGSYSHPCIFEINSVYYLIAGENDGVWNGYHWDTNTWVGDSDIVDGLTIIGNQNTPEVYKVGSTYNLISGSKIRTFYGWSMEVAPPAPATNSKFFMLF